MSAERTSTAESLINKYKLFGTKSKQTVNFSNMPKKPFPSTSSKKHIMIEEFKDRIKDLKIYIEWDKKKLKQEINEIQKETKRKFNN